MFSLLKPEWYLLQAFNWIKDESDFINRLVQPVFAQVGYLKDKSALVSTQLSLF